MSVPPRVAGELVRPRVVELLQGRWDVPITTVVGGAGSGKSIAVAQAVRHNALAPRGIDAWVSCRGNLGDWHRLARRLLAALGREEDDRVTPELLHAVAADCSPTDVCFVFDDVDAAARAPDLTAGLDRLVADPPDNLHVLLCGRELPRLSIARARAAGDVLAVETDDLRLTEVELASLGERSALRERVLDAGGWPALLGLLHTGATAGSATRSTTSTTDYLWEEIVRGLLDDDRATLLALAALGSADLATLAAVCGRPIDAEGFRRRVPLVHVLGDQLLLHDLWRDALAELVPVEELAEVDRRAATRLVERRDFAAAGTVAARAGDLDLLGVAAVELLIDNVASLPVALAQRWLAAVPAERETPPLALLRAAARHAVDVAEPPPDELDELIERTALDPSARGHRTHLATLALATLAAYDNGDIPRLLGLAARTNALTGADHVAELELLQRSVTAAVAEMSGDVDAGLGSLSPAIAGLDRSAYPEAVNRLHWHLLLLAGRADDAAALAHGVEDLALSPTRPLEGVARWFAGDPDGLDATTMALEIAQPDRGDLFEQRDLFLQATFAACLWSCVGDREQVDRALATIDAMPDWALAPGDRAHAAVARACGRVLRHDEPAAAQVLADLWRDHGTVPGVEVHLRRSLAIAYVAVPELQARWDDAPLGRTQLEVRRVARTLVAARAGTVVLDPLDPARVHTALPLPWAVELAVRQHDQGDRAGLVLAQWLADRLGPPVLAELRHLADGGPTGDGPTDEGPHDRADLRDPAARLRGLLAVPPAAHLRIELVGPIRTWRDGEATAIPELRRERVRELLALLVVRSAVTREQAVDLLWPELSFERGRQNLRVTLTHLQKALDPERRIGERPYHLRVEGDTLRLVRDATLSIDCWDLDDELAAAERAATAGNVNQQERHLAAAVACWRGRPLADLDRIDELGTEVAAITRSLQRAATGLGELRLVRGEPDGALALAERVLAEDPYDERAHRLAIAAQLHRGDAGGTLATVARLATALDEVGAVPDDRTRMALRQVRARHPGAALPFDDVALAAT